MKEVALAIWTSEHECVVEGCCVTLSVLGQCHYKLEESSSRRLNEVDQNKTLNISQLQHTALLIERDLL